jgi:hypothetical protein
MKMDHGMLMIQEVTQLRNHQCPEETQDYYVLMSPNAFLCKNVQQKQMDRILMLETVLLKDSTIYSTDRGELLCSNISKNILSESSVMNIGYRETTHFCELYKEVIEATVI